MNGDDSSAYDSPPKRFPDSSAQKDASPETTANKSPLVTPAHCNESPNEVALELTKRLLDPKRRTP